MFPAFAYTYVLVLAATIMVLAALSDAARFRIPNLASLALLLLFPVYVYLAPHTVRWGEHLLVMFVVLGCGYYLFAKSLAGAGDIKLISAISLWAGTAYCLHFLFITAVSGGILSLGIGASSLLRAKMSKDAAPISLAKTPIPYGVAIAVGGLCTLALLSHPDLIHPVV
jgi:prepilin peptidase CpaA